jgi:hypothetical protein
MSRNNLIVHKLSLSGKLLDVSNLNYISLFGPSTVLVAYNKKSKTLYTWIGDKAPKSLRHFIPKIRKILTKTYPEYSVLRYVTIDAYSEPEDFLKMMDIDKKALENQLKNLERKRISIISDIDQLKVKENNLLMTNKFEEAINTANEIIELAKELNDLAMQEEQKKFLEGINEKRENSKKVSLIKEKTEILEPLLEDINNEQDIIGAHKAISQFSDKWWNIIRMFEIESATKLIKSERTIWREFIEKQKEKMDQLTNKVANINQSISRGDLKSVQNTIKEISDEINNVIDYEIKAGWLEQKSQLIDSVNNFGLKAESISSLKEADILIEEDSYDSASKILNSALDKIKNTNLNDEAKSIMHKLSDIEEKKQHYLYNRQKLKNLKNSYNKALDTDNLEVALLSAQSIVGVAEELEQPDLIEKYSRIVKNLQRDIDKIEQAKRKEREKLFEQAKELEKIIQVDENVLPLVEELSADDIIGDISEDVDKMLDQISNLLINHRVEVKEEIKNKTLIKSVSGEILEIEKDIKAEEDNKQNGAIVSSGLTNPFDEMIEEAILTDLIPYNYEIDAIELDGKMVDEFPENKLTKEGIELSWTLHNIKPKKKVNLEYNLRRRVSRSILFILQKQLKIIKTHSNINNLDLEGFFEANMPFSNNFGTTLGGIVIEDIIPLYYVHYIKKPENIIPDKTKKSESGELIEWNVKSLLPGKTKNYTYKLLELIKYEEIKISIRDLNKKAEKELNKGKIQKAIEKYKNIIGLLKKYTK